MSPEAVRFEPSLEGVVDEIIEAVRSSQEIDIGMWYETESLIVAWQEELFNTISGLKNTESTILTKKSKYGKRVRVGRSGRTETVKYISEAGHYTGFLRDRLASSQRLRGYNLPRFEKAGVTKRGHYEFGVRPEFFYNEYPLILAEWLRNKGIPNLINVDEGKVEQLSAFMFNLIWDKIAARLASI